MTEAEAESVLTRGPLVGIPEADCLSRGSRVGSSFPVVLSSFFPSSPVKIFFFFFFWMRP